jgi:hypothetical protein
MVSYKPTTASAPATQNASLNLGFVGVPAGTPQTVALSGTSAALPVGQVIGTNNPQVALYMMMLPFPGSVTVNFGKDTTYGTETWAQSTPEGGGLVSIFVAGMQGATTYHMQASVQFTNGISANDIDRNNNSGHDSTTWGRGAQLALRHSVWGGSDRPYWGRPLDLRGSWTCHEYYSGRQTAAERQLPDGHRSELI